MIHSEKIKEFHNYLNSDFSGKKLGDKYDADRKTVIFTLRIEDYTVFVTGLEEFFDDNKDLIYNNLGSKIYK